MEYYVVKYSGPFGYIKPWTAVRDSETFSQQFLTPSIIAGMQKKFFPELQEGGNVILRHRLNYCGIDVQQERTWSKGGFKYQKEKGIYKDNRSTLKRGVLLMPNLYLAFSNLSYAEKAFQQSICLCRNEDLLFPEFIAEKDEQAFNVIAGFELMPADEHTGFKVGYNRFVENAAMYGRLAVTGNPIRNED
ncbi:hypothetical protein [Chitinophaga qingshengii]|uniref:Nucleotide modification associated domain-containing protein n=1 Tax=Chitinophaga qingshengii TaxID=1569794 RepID=A0ABR7TF40_9BACT|nr:hypothetical protein [Chitinophaga qingshengii]MBC9928897.1 hypothetical protein [Chitinophaga qingshengii]